MVTWWSNFFCGAENRKIESMKVVIDANSQTIVEQNDKIIKQASEITKKDLEIISLKEEIGKLKQEQSIQPVKPAWLDTNGYAYIPQIQYVKTGGKIDFFRLDDPRDIYLYSDTLRKVVEREGWIKQPLDERLKNIWHWVIGWANYEFDYAEAWSFPIETYYRKAGDCEDTTILFITLCHLAGIADVWNACGWWYVGSQKIGHSFPIAKKEDGQYYVYETTLDGIFPSEPVLFKYSPYDAVWGFSNAFFSGGLRKELGTIGGKWQI